MDLYDFLKLGHILFAVAWVGAGFMVILLSGRAMKSPDPGETKRLVESAAWMTDRFFIPSSILVLIFGALAVWQSDVWGFSDTWVLIGLGGYALSFLLGVGYLGPTSGRARTAFDERGPEDAEGRRLAGQLVKVGRIDLVIMLVVITNMVIKPGT